MTNEEFLESNVIWKVRLNDGEVLIQSHPDCNPYGACTETWQLLRNFIQFTHICLHDKRISTKYNKNIVNLSLSFRSNNLNILKENAEGYFLINGVASDWNAPSFSFITIGYVESDKVYCYKVKTPELIILTEEVRDLKDCANECIIWNKH